MNHRIALISVSADPAILEHIQKSFDESAFDPCGAIEWEKQGSPMVCSCWGQTPLGMQTLLALSLRWPQAQFTALWQARRGIHEMACLEGGTVLENARVVKKCP